MKRSGFYGKNINSVFNDIETIKNSIEKSKSNANSLYKILIIYGIINLTYFLIPFILGITFKINSITLYTNIILSICIYTFLLIYYIKKYIIEKVTSNKYYIAFLNIWMVIAILLPIFQLIIRILTSFTSNSAKNAGIVSAQLQNIGMFANILLLLFSMVVTSYILNKISIRFISIVMLLIYLMLATIYNNLTIPIMDNISIPMISVYYYTTMSIGYLTIGLLLKHEVNVKNGII